MGAQSRGDGSRQFAAAELIALAERDQSGYTKSEASLKWGASMKNPVDTLIAQRLRMRRLMQGMTQTQLAAAVGIRFQQIQKYESGLNRVSAARLWSLSRALNTNVSTFFDGSVEGSTGQNEPFYQQEAIELVRAYLAMTDIPRRRLRDLARAMSTTTNKMSSRREA